MRQGQAGADNTRKDPIAILFPARACQYTCSLWRAWFLAGPLPPTQLPLLRCLQPEYLTSCVQEVLQPDSKISWPKCCCYQVQNWVLASWGGESTNQQVPVAVACAIAVSKLQGDPSMGFTQGSAGVGYPAPSPGYETPPGGSPEALAMLADVMSAPASGRLKAELVMPPVCMCVHDAAGVTAVERVQQGVLWCQPSSTSTSGPYLMA
jgi:hypothetical protein